MPKQYYSTLDTVLDMRRMAPTKLYLRHSDKYHDLITCPYCKATGRLNEDGLVVEHRLEVVSPNSVEVTDYCTLKIFNDWRDAAHNPLFAKATDVLRVAANNAPHLLPTLFAQANPVAQYVAVHRGYIPPSMVEQYNLVPDTLEQLSMLIGMRRHGNH